MCDNNDDNVINATWQNLQQPMPLSRKLYLVMRNSLKKFRTGQGCCGNYGEPGC